MVLEIVNVIDTVCTQILVEELEKHRKKIIEISEPSPIEDSTLKKVASKKVDPKLDPKHDRLNPIKEEEEEQKGEQEFSMVEDLAHDGQEAKFLSDFMIEHKYIQLGSRTSSFQKNQTSIQRDEPQSSIE